MDGFQRQEPEEQLQEGALGQAEVPRSASPLPQAGPWGRGPESCTPTCTQIHTVGCAHTQLHVHAPTQGRTHT